MKNLKISSRLIVFMLIIGIVPLLISIIVTNSTMSSRLEYEAQNTLSAVQAGAIGNLQSFFNFMETTVEVTALNQEFVDFVEKLNEIGVKANLNSADPFPVKNPEYLAIHDKVHKHLAAVKEKYELYDIFIIGLDYGRVMYTVAKESDFGTNLSSGSLRDSGLAELWRGVKGSSSFTYSDFKPYTPSNNKYASFLGCPIKTDDGRIIGIMAFQLSEKLTDIIVQGRTGMGETGENFILGRDPDGKVTYRSNRIVKDGKIGDQKGDPYAEWALDGKKGAGVIIGPTGVKEIVVYCPLKINGLKWAIASTKSYEEAVQVARELRNLLIIIMISISILVALAAFFISKTISDPINLLLRRVQNLSSGDADLTRRIESDSNDELGALGKAINNFIEVIQSLIKDVKSNAESVSAASVEISASSEELAATVEEQSRNAGVVGESVSELSTTSNDIARNVDDSRAVTIKSAELTKNGGEIIGNSIESLNAIGTHTENLGQTVDRLAQSTSQIGNIIDVINDVADQTNLLALNAAIEAARAGEAGRGFAVVADEVRKLAERTGTATKEIEGIIVNLQKEADAAGKAMVMAKEEVEKGTSLGQESLTILHEIIQTGSEVDSSTESIASAITEENATIDLISNNIQEITTGIQQSSNAVSEVATTAESLAMEAEKLRDIVNSFKTD